MTLSLLTVHTLAQDLLTCVCSALDDAAAEVPGHPPCPCVSCLAPGPRPALDYCASDCGTDCGGELHVGLERMYPTRDFPAPFTGVRNDRTCPPLQTAVTYVITLARCTVVMDDQGIPPTCDELTQAARTLHVDAVAVQRALECCLPGIVIPGTARTRYVIGEPAFTVEGGCQTLTTRVTFLAGGCACP